MAVKMLVSHVLLPQKKYILIQIMSQLVHYRNRIISQTAEDLLPVMRRSSDREKHQDRV